MTDQELQQLAKAHAVNSTHEYARGKTDFVAHEWVIDAMRDVRRRVIAEQARPLVVAAEVDARIERLQGFKDFVHKRLTDMKVPEQFPDGVHSKAGCRIGDRLEFVDRLLTNPIFNLDDSPTTEASVAFNKEKLFTDQLARLINRLSLESHFGNYADYVLAQRVWNNLTATARVDKVVAEASDMTFDPYLDVHMKKTLLDVTDQGRAAHRLLVDGHKNASGPETWIPDLAAIRERKITEASKALGGFPDNWWVHRANHTGKVGEEQEVASLNYLLQFEFEQWADIPGRLERVKFLEKNLRARWRLMLLVHPNGGATWRSVPL